MVARFFLFLGSMVTLATVSSTATASDEAGILVRLAEANDLVIEARLAGDETGAYVRGMPRTFSTHLLFGALAHADANSRWHRSSRVLELMERDAAALGALQREGGLFDEGNLDSPPDSAFVVSALCKMLRLLDRDESSDTEGLRHAIAEIVRRATPGLLEGGVHTPNHRWHLAATLAEIHALHPDPRLPVRIDEWLAEGIDIDPDGFYGERSPHYSAEVVNPALVELGHALERKDLLDVVRRNLEASLALIEPNGEVEAVFSRRQDQREGVRKYLADNFFAYRFFATKDGDGRWAALARRIERDQFDLVARNQRNPNAAFPLLALFREAAGELPADVALPESFVHHYAHNGIVRIRKGTTTTTINGASDAASGLGFGSGLAMNPTFLRFRRGAAVLDGVRLVPQFFSTGFFYPWGVDRIEGGWRLRELRRVPYYLPLPPESRRADGDYTLGADGRFFAKMEFDRRPVHTVDLEIRVDVREREDGGFDLDFDVDGRADVPVTIELSFREGGVLEGVDRLDSGGPEFAGAFALRRGDGRYRVGEDEIVFGPGSFEGPPVRGEHESVRWVNGSMRAVGQRVYVTLRTPVRYTMTLR
ncbi:hypothetical protein ASA1KI_39930 [Opitutales bacterium ASA1]|nr:hypothetical protein ASA1KI_39930 [Opitutales bacterium ASA1]